nr:uncharacterized protein LOC106682639 [Halyomorpha halys]
MGRSSELKCPGFQYIDEQLFPYEVRPCQQGNILAIVCAHLMQSKGESVMVMVWATSTQENYTPYVGEDVHQCPENLSTSYPIEDIRDALLRRLFVHHWQLLNLETEKSITSFTR